MTRNGTITALAHRLVWDAGASAEYGANVVNAVGLSATGPYRVPNVKIDSVCVYTNMPPGGAYRGFGYSEFHFGLESVSTRRHGHGHGSGEVPQDQRDPGRRHAGLWRGHESQRAARRHRPRRQGDPLGQKPKSVFPDKAIGKGFSCFWKAPAMPPNASSAAFLKFNEDGCDEPRRLRHGDRAGIPDRHGAGRRRSADRPRRKDPRGDARHRPQLLRVADRGLARHVELRQRRPRRRRRGEASSSPPWRARQEPEGRDLYLADECVKSRKDKKFALPFRDFVIDGIMRPNGNFIGGPIHGTGHVHAGVHLRAGRSRNQPGRTPQRALHGRLRRRQVEVDKETGKLTVLKAVRAVDAGKAINPGLVKGQIVGGIVQGLATALYEDIRYDAARRLLNPNFTDYKIPTALDFPIEIVPIILETPQPDGPFGARGVGEHTMVPAAPMVADAIDDAVGIRLKTMPITAEKVVSAIIEKEGRRGAAASRGFAWWTSPGSLPDHLHHDPERSRRRRHQGGGTGSGR